MSWIELKGISKRFTTASGPVTALQGVTASLPKGAIIGLLGPNGSGKTTLLRILMGILPADSGEVWCEGSPLSASLRRTFGYMPEERGLYPKMRAEDQLSYFLQLKGYSAKEAQKEIRYWAERMEAPWLHRPARALSKGMQQKVQLILALAGNPPFLLLDEPFSGLDPVVATEVETILRERVQSGATLLLSTHRLEQADHLCDYVLLIHKGQLRLAGQTAALKQQYKTHSYEIETSAPLDALPWPTEVTLSPHTSHRATIHVSSTLTGKALLELLLPHTDVRFFAEKLPTIKEIFLQTVTTA
ncbi:MAG: ATP-binding cassette domain-containing protein [Bacteroidia bacterium]|nr:ATP-binding cassette domain-containing protein [Bacteroidia bacterium]